MKYLKKYNESSRKANALKYNREHLLGIVDEILEEIKLDGYIYEIEWTIRDYTKFQISISVSDDWGIVGKKSDILTPLNRLEEYLKREEFYLCYILTSSKFYLDNPNEKNGSKIEDIPEEFEKIWIEFKLL